MMKHMMKTCCAALLLVSLLCMLTPAALADGEPETAPAAPTDAVTIGTDGTVTVTSSHMAAEKISSVQLKLNVGQAEAVFTFNVGDTYMKNTSLEKKEEGNILSLYIAGATPLMAEGVTQLELGKLTGMTDMSKVMLVPNSLEYVYGTRTVSQAITAPQLESSTGGTVTDLKQLIERADAICGEEGANAENYTLESWGNLQQALDNAKTVAQDPNATPEQQNEAYNVLNAAINALVPVDRAALEKAVADAKAKLTDGKTYDATLVTALEEAIKTAEAAIDANAANTIWKDLQTKIEEIMEKMTPIVNGEGGGGTAEDPSGGDTDDTEPTATPTATAAAASQNVAPNTGDGQALLPWAALLVLSGALLTVVIRRRARCGR